MSTSLKNMKNAAVVGKLYDHLEGKQKLNTFCIRQGKRGPRIFLDGEELLGVIEFGIDSGPHKAPEINLKMLANFESNEEKEDKDE